MNTASEGIYTTLTGRRINLLKLTVAEKECLTRVEKTYRTLPEWTEFSAWWIQEVQSRGVPVDSKVYMICNDLEGRLGIAQGKAAPPDYRDYLVALIEERFVSRYNFCKETGIDQAQLSRILQGKADFSMQALRKILVSLEATLVVQANEILSETSDPRQASRVLAELPR